MRLQTTFLTLVLLFASACAKSGSSDSVSAAGQPGQPGIFSNWAAKNGSYTVDLTGLSFDQQAPFQWTFANGSVCTANMILDGDDISFGTATVTDSTFTSGNAGDPGCANLNHVYFLSYSQSGTDMIACPYPSGTCVDFVKAN